MDVNILQLTIFYKYSDIESLESSSGSRLLIKTESKDKFLLSSCTQSNDSDPDPFIMMLFSKASHLQSSVTKRDRSGYFPP